jgi:hypothetical protein
MVLQMILRTNYEGQDQVRGRTIFPSRLPSYPPLLHGNKMLLVQVSLDSSYHDDVDNNEDDVFTGCCYPYKRIVALDESHFRHSSSTRTTTTAFDLFYITTQQRDNHDHDDNNKENNGNSSSNNATWIHQLALVPTVTNCRDWERWTFLGECQTCMLRLHIAKYLQQLSLQSGLLLPSVQKKGCVDYPHHHHGHHQPTTNGRRRRRRRDHWHMEAFIDRIFIPTHPPHYLADHPNIHQCSRAHHARLSKRAAFSDISNTSSAASAVTASSSSSTSQQHQHQQQEQDDVYGQELKNRSVRVPITRWKKEESKDTSVLPTAYSARIQTKTCVSRQQET